MGTSIVRCLHISELLRCSVLVVCGSYPEIAKVILCISSLDAPKIRMLKAVELGDSQQGAMGVYAIGEGVNYDEIDFTICYTAWQTTRCTPSSGVNKNVTIALPGTSVTASWQPKPANYTSNCIGTASWYVRGSKSTLLQVNASITLTISTKYGGCAQSPSLTFNLAEYFGPEQHSCQQLNSSK